MARCPIVAPKITRLTLPDGEWLDVKAELNAGEYRDMLASQFTEGKSANEPVVDFKNIGRGRVLAYLLGWSFENTDGKPLPATGDSLDLVDVQTWQQILDAVDAHHEAWEKARDASKNVPAGESASSSISS